jgi:hypothetical protein
MYECAFKISSLIPIFNPLVNFKFHIFNHCVIFHPFGKKFLIFSSTMQPSKISKASLDVVQFGNVAKIQGKDIFSP